MPTLSLEGYIHEYGKFPESADANGFLAVLPILVEDDLDLVLFGHKVSRTQVGLIKFTDNSSDDLTIYRVFFPIFYFKNIFSSAEPIPFCAPDDRIALDKLREAINKYNTIGQKVYSQGTIIEMVYDKENPEKQELLKMARDPGSYRNQHTLVDEVTLSLQ